MHKHGMSFGSRRANQTKHFNNDDFSRLQ